MRGVGSGRDWTLPCAIVFSVGRSHQTYFGQHHQFDQIWRSTIIFLISAIALPGFNPLGQVRVQLRMVWQR